MNTLEPRLIDTHAHLDDEQFDGDRDAVVQRAQAAGVSRFINVGYRPARWVSTLSLADRFPEISFTLGLHPHHAGEWNDATERELRRLLEERRPVAIGEIGLDFYRNLTPMAEQRHAFIQQLEIAAEWGLPVVIHQRAAEAELMTILRSTPEGLACILHSFDGTAEYAAFAINRGYFLGIGGLMTRGNSVELRRVLAAVPLNQLILETDAPYLVPAGVKSRRNEPANLVTIAEKLSELLSIEHHELVAAVAKNTERAFKQTF